MTPDKHPSATHPLGLSSLTNEGSRTMFPGIRILVSQILSQNAYKVKQLQLPGLNPYTPG